MPSNSDADANALTLTWRNRYLDLTFGCGAYISYESLVSRAARDVELPDDAAVHLCEKWEGLKPWPEMRGVLGRPREKGIKLRVVTNCSRELERTAVGRVVWSLMLSVVTAEEAGFVSRVSQIS